MPEFGAGPSAEGVVPSSHVSSSGGANEDVQHSQSFRSDAMGKRFPSGAAHDNATEVSALYRLTDRLYRAATLGEAYEAAFAAISDLMGSSRASILQFDELGVMRFVAWRGLSDAYRQAASGHSPWRLGEREADPIMIADVAWAPELDPFRQVILEEGIRALAFIPLTCDEAVIGKFMVYYDAPTGFTARDRELAVLIARQLSFSIQRYTSEQAVGRLAALVDSSDDAILATDLDGRIRSWNSGAEALFGYTAGEMVGQAVGILQPPDCQDNEASILDRVRSGERIKSYETIRRRKDGSCVDISLTVSPILDRHGHVIGVSRIARDISERRLAQAKQDLLMREMSHRIKNLFALANSLVNLSARTAGTPQVLAADVSQRLTALARVHAMTMPSIGSEEPAVPALHALIRAVLAPYEEAGPRGPARFSIEGVDALVAPNAISALALVLYELASNAAKYGALSTPAGRVQVQCDDAGNSLQILWRESGGPPVPHASQYEGFGAQLVQAASLQLGPITRHWHREGLVVELALSKMHLTRLGNSP